MAKPNENPPVSPFSPEKKIQVACPGCHKDPPGPGHHGAVHAVGVQGEHGLAAGFHGLIGLVEGKIYRKPCFVFSIFLLNLGFFPVIVPINYNPIR